MASACAKYKALPARLGSAHSPRFQWSVLSREPLPGPTRADQPHRGAKGLCHSRQTWCKLGWSWRKTWAFCSICESIEWGWAEWEASYETDERDWDIFHSFFAHLNPLIYILDRQLHTPVFCRHRSAILFSAILLTSAKVVRPDLYETSLDHVNHLVGIAFQSGVSTTELVQSLSILVFWRESDDSSSYGKIGHAIRTAYELKLNVQVRPLPQDHSQARLALVSGTCGSCLAGLTIRAE